MNTELKYRTFDELLYEVGTDFVIYNNENLIEPAQLIKVAQRVNYDLGLRIHGTKEKMLDIDDEPIQKADGAKEERRAPAFVEPLLRADENRYVMFPIQYPDVWDMYKRSVDSFWIVNEVNLAQDLSDWSKLTTDEQNFIKMVLAFSVAVTALSWRI